MPLKIVRADITKFPCDAVVNAANESLLGGGGVDGAIHRAAGSELYKECLALGGCRTGEAKITSGCKMPCRYIIHTVGPIWRGGDSGEKQLLESCYRNSLSLALKNGCESVAFPMISAGVYGYPKEQAFRVASDTILDFLATHEQADDMTVYIVIFDSDSFLRANKLFSDIESYIDDNYAQSHTDEPAEKAADYLGESCRTQRPHIVFLRLQPHTKKRLTICAFLKQKRKRKTVRLRMHWAV